MNTLSPSETNRIRAHRRARGWTLQQLADASGTSKSQIDKLEKGERRLTVDWMVRLAHPLGCAPQDLLAEALAFQPVRFAADPREPAAMIPVKNLIVSKAGKLRFAEDPIDQVPRPYTLTHVKEAYALYMPDDKMVPMYRARQLLFVNPYKPPLSGGGVVLTGAEDGVLLGEFVKATPKAVTLRTYHPARTFAVTITEGTTIHAIIGTMESA